MVEREEGRNLTLTSLNSATQKKIKDGKRAEEGRVREKRSGIICDRI